MDGRPTDGSQLARETSPTASSEPRRGAPRIVADYELGARLTRYPTADAFLAVHRPTGAPRVLYVLRPAAMQDRALVHRAALEVDTARWLRHPAIPALDPCGETAEGRLYVAVEHRPGRSLAACIAEQGRLDVARLVRAATQTVEALDEAHAAGLVHGRLSPASIVLGALDERGREAITLVGLGTAAATAGEITAAERPFTSPEQLAGAAPDARSDVYALASVLQLALDLDGRPLDAAGGTGTGTPADVIAVALSADPAARFPGVKAFWEELLGALVRKAGAEATGTARLAPAMPGAGLASALELDDEPVATPDVAAPPAELPRPVRARSGRRRVAAGLVAAGLLVAAATGLALTVDRRADVPPAASTALGAASGGETQGAAEPSTGTPASPDSAAVAEEPGAAADSAAAAESRRVAPVVAPKVPVVVVPVEIPGVDVAPAALPRAEVVRAEEFAAPAAGTAALAAARQEMERALAAFASALESRDAERLRRAAPDMPADRHAFWAGVFRDARQVRAELTVLDVRLGDQVIVADVRSRVTVQSRGAKPPMHSDAVLAATLVRDGSGWRLKTTR